MEPSLGSEHGPNKTDREFVARETGGETVENVETDQQSPETMSAGLQEKLKIAEALGLSEEATEKIKLEEQKTSKEASERQEAAAKEADSLLGEFLSLPGIDEGQILMFKPNEELLKALKERITYADQNGQSAPKAIELGGKDQTIEIIQFGNKGLICIK